MEKQRHRQLLRDIFIFSFIFILLLLFVILLLTYILLRHNKVTKLEQSCNLTTLYPRYIVEDADVIYYYYPRFYLSSNNLTTTMNVTLSAFNPNRHISIYYQKLEAYASYHGQKISLPTEIPATYQDHYNVTVWSLLLNGTHVPVPPYVLNSLQQDVISGETFVNVMVNGTVKWKLGTFHIDVNCSVYMMLVDGGENNAIGVAAPAPTVKVQPVQSCDVTMSK